METTPPALDLWMCARVCICICNVTVTINKICMVKWEQQIKKGGKKCAN